MLEIEEGGEDGRYSLEEHSCQLLSESGRWGGSRGMKGSHCTVEASAGKRM